jgi:hypothetical protein
MFIGALSRTVFRTLSRSKVIALLILVLSCAATYWLGLISKQIRQPINPLVVPEDCLHFGEVWEEKSFRLSLPVRNPTNNDVKIAGFDTSCTCVAIQPSSVTIPPGGVVDLNIRIDLSAGASPAERSRPVHSFSATLLPRLRESLPFEQGWQIHGRVRRVLTLQGPSPIFLGDLVRGQSVEPRSVKLSAHVPLSALTCRCDSSLASAHVVKAPGFANEYELIIGPKAWTEAPGSPEFQVVLEPLHIDGTPLPPVKVAVKAVFLEDISARPAAVVLGVHNLGETVSETVTLASHAKHPFDIEGFTADSPDVTVEHLVSAGKPDSKSYRVAQRITQRGEHTHSVLFSLRDHKGKKQIVKVELKYYGISN